MPKFCETPAKKIILEKLAKYITDDKTIKDSDKKKTFEDLYRVLGIGCEDTIKKIRRELNESDERLKKLENAYDLNNIIYELSKKNIILSFNNDLGTTYLKLLNRIYTAVNDSTNDQKENFVDEYKDGINRMYDYINTNPPIKYTADSVDDDGIQLYEPGELANYVNNYNLESESDEGDDEDGEPREPGKQGGKGKPKAKSKKNKISQKKQSECKEILGKKMKIYKMPDSRKEYVKYKGELLHISDYKNLMKQKAIAKTKTKTKATQQKAIAKTKTKK
jgi:hypothetical protein